MTEQGQWNNAKKVSSLLLEVNPAKCEEYFKYVEKTMRLLDLKRAQKKIAKKNISETKILSDLAKHEYLDENELLYSDDEEYNSSEDEEVSNSEYSELTVRKPIPILDNFLNET